ncbi:MAG TPA: hypothetical protein VLG12_06135 [Candidatus Saccharimonadales bacterium]|nr:hypothetical protein [Candidatus Saccharimonadales bacterium]
MIPFQVKKRYIVLLSIVLIGLSIGTSRQTDTKAPSQNGLPMAIVVIGHVNIVYSPSQTTIVTIPNAPQTLSIPFSNLSNAPQHADLSVTTGVVTGNINGHVTSLFPTSKDDIIGVKVISGLQDLFVPLAQVISVEKTFQVRTLGSQRWTCVKTNNGKFYVDC